MSGREIRIFLVDGTVSGLRTAQLGLSTIKALVVPRASLPAAAKRDEVRRTGTYILVGRDSDKPGVWKIYVGEADTVLTRLSAHNKDADKDFWEEAVVFVSKDENLTKAHCRYLEARLIALARQAKRCTVTNGGNPSDQGKLPEAEEVEMEEFISQARLLLGTLGFDLFSPIQEPSSPPQTGPTAPQPLVEFCYQGDGFAATCRVDSNSGQFIVLKGSKARKHEGPGMGQTYKNLRAQLIDMGVLAEETDSYRFTQDYAFTAISAAAAVVYGTNVNGRRAWKLKGAESTTFADWQDQQLPSES